MGTIKKQLPRWSASEDDVLCQFVGKETAREIGKRVGRSKGAVLERIKAKGLEGKPQGTAHSWTEEQMNALKSAGGEISSRDFARKWRLGEGSVRWWARKLGIKFKQKDRWTAEQEDRLRFCETVESAMGYFGRTRRSVLCKAQSLGLTLQSPRSGRPRGSKSASTRVVGVRAEKVWVRGFDRLWKAKLYRWYITHFTKVSQ